MFGRFIGLMHSSGIFHSDLKTCNILVSESRMPAVGHAEKSWDRPLSFSLLDYDHVAFRRQLIQKKRVKNLVQIFLSTPLAVRASDRLRFMREYSLHAGIDHRDRRRMEREVLEAASGHRILYVGFQGDISELWD